LESLLITILRIVGILQSKLILYFSLFSEEEKNKALGERFLKTKETETLLEECLAMHEFGIFLENKLTFQL